MRIVVVVFNDDSALNRWWLSVVESSSLSGLVEGLVEVATIGVMSARVLQDCWKPFPSSGPLGMRMMTGDVIVSVVLVVLLLVLVSSDFGGSSGGGGVCDGESLILSGVQTPRGHGRKLSTRVSREAG